MGTRSPRPSRPARRRSLGSALLAALSAACATTPPTVPLEDLPPVAAIETVHRLEVRPVEDDIGAAVIATLSVKPKESVPLKVLGRQRAGHPGDDAQLELRVAWTDFVGVQPMSFGRSESRVVVFGDDAEGDRSRPVEREFQLVIDPPEDRVLARRVTVSARLHPVDVVAGEARSGGASLSFGPASVELLRREPEASLDEVLVSGDPAALFLRAAADGRGEGRLAVVGRLLDGLGQVGGPGREAIFGALQFLTGETRGRDERRWREWLGEQQS